MMNWIAGACFAFLSVFGFICLLYELFYALFAREEQPSFLLIPLAAQEDAEIRIKQARMRARRMGGGQVHILILDKGMSEAVREIALHEALEDENIRIVSVNELQNLD